MFAISARKWPRRTTFAARPRDEQNQDQGTSSFFEAGTDDGDLQRGWAAQNSQAVAALGPSVMTHMGASAPRQKEKEEALCAASIINQLQQAGVMRRIASSPTAATNRRARASMTKHLSHQAETRDVVALKNMGRWKTQVLKFQIVWQYIVPFLTNIVELGATIIDEVSLGRLIKTRAAGQRALSLEGQIQRAAKQIAEKTADEG